MKLRLGLVPGLDGIRTEMLKYGGWGVWKSERVPQDRTSTVIVPLYKGKGCGDLHPSCRGVSLLSILDKVYGRMSIERVKDN